LLNSLVYTGLLHILYALLLIKLGADSFGTPPAFIRAAFVRSSAPSL
jgi:hypothetical protein